MPKLKGNVEYNDFDPGVYYAYNRETRHPYKYMSPDVYDIIGIDKRDNPEDIFYTGGDTSSYIGGTMHKTPYVTLDQSRYGMDTGSYLPKTNDIMENIGRFLMMLQGHKMDVPQYIPAKVDNPEWGMNTDYENSSPFLLRRPENMYIKNPRYLGG